ncbi:FAD-dependent oxidoreductase [Pseudomonas sp. NA-150]|uniref:FAD-dependent oxidoreductase n=1 Tax=Pseudomonas sp. NA-150 TaxID=3367525 RepID=UPI0037C53A3A
MPLHIVARFAELAEDRGIEVEIGKNKILLLRSGDQVRAYQAECPHAGAPLAEGAICNGRLICPWHKAAFAIENGQLCEPPALLNLTRYPAQVVGDQVQVDDQAMPPVKPAANKDDRCFALIGAGAAGTAAASALRDSGFGGRLLLIDREAEPGYDRTVLSKFVLAGEMTVEETPPLLDAAFYREQRIERIHGEVTRLDVVNKRLTLRDGRDFNYHAALLATGGQPRALDLPGAGLPQVLLLRSRQDTQRIIDAAPAARHAVIIGDSFIGLEAASSLRQRGLTVTVLARHEVPFAAQFGERIGRAIRTLHEQNGVVFRTQVEATHFEGTDRLQAVALNNGEQLPADLVLIGIGVNPATEWVEGIKCEDDGSLRVDDTLRAAEGLWVAGDIATFALHDQPRRIEHWRLAQQQARIAAHNMLGSEERYSDVPFFWTYHFGKNFDYLGHAEQWDDIVFEGTPEQYAFIALLCQNGIVAAVVACEYQRVTSMLADRMKRPLAMGEALKLIRIHSEQ